MKNIKNCLCQYCDKSFQEQGFQVTFDPPGDGNCQFRAQLDQLCIQRSTSKVREEIVKYLEENQND